MAKDGICIIPGCCNPILNKPRGWCSKHYQRWQRYGDPLVVKMRRYQANEACEIDGCEQQAKVRGLCALHNDRRRRTGDPNKPYLNERFRAIVNWIDEHKAHPLDDCLNWPFYRNGTGRGVVIFEGKGRSAPNAMCRAAHGAPPTEDHEAAHSCGNGHLGCVNPKHLRWATRAENEADKVRHGTLRRGRSINTSKLSEDDVRSIRASAERGTVLAERFGVSTAAISSIRKRHSWDWLT